MYSKQAHALKRTLKNEHTHTRTSTQHTRATHTPSALHRNVAHGASSRCTLLQPMGTKAYFHLSPCQDYTNKIQNLLAIAPVYTYITYTQTANTYCYLLLDFLLCIPNQNPDDLFIKQSTTARTFYCLPVLFYSCTGGAHITWKYPYYIPLRVPRGHLLHTGNLSNSRSQECAKNKKTP